MGLNVVATLAAAVALATPAGYVAGQQRDDGGFGDAQLTAWATLGLAAAGADATTLDRAAAYLAKQDPREPTEVALVAMARTVAGDRPEALLARLRHAPSRKAPERDDLVDPRPPSSRRACPSGPCPLAPRRAAELRRLVVARRERSRHERHRRGDSGAPRRRRRRASDRPRASRSSAATRTETAASSSRSAVARTSNRRPGRSRRSSRAADRPALLPTAISSACVGPTAVTATRLVRDDAALGDRRRSCPRSRARPFRSAPATGKGVWRRRRAEETARYSGRRSRMYE